ncbi:MAG: alpha-galactosidase [Treponemataceae bacterium]|nr:alpha-galactosidase [Treponemataceae bacterium]
MEIPNIKRLMTKETGPGQKRYTFQYMATEAHTVEEYGHLVDSFSYEELASWLRELEGDGAADFFSNSRELVVHPGGWQSWSAGWELGPGEVLPRKVAVVPELIRFTNRDGDAPARGEIVGHWIVYFRRGSQYVVLASKEGSRFPPTTYRICPRARRVSIEIFARGKTWKAGDILAELSLFFAPDYFLLKDTLRSLYRQDHNFHTLAFLTAPDALPGGYESWYNHYTHIDEALIRQDLEDLSLNDNFIKRYYLDKNRPLVFQIDDGWERAVGQWEIDERKFPRGLKPLAQDIEERGYIPGLWIAPFLVTRRAELFHKHPDWLLRDEKGDPVVAGFNDKWDGRFYTLDLSLPEVLAYLSQLMDTIIDGWGFRYLKLDFMYAGLLHGAFGGGGAAYQWYHRACQILTRRVQDGRGRPVAYLGCGVPFGQSYPYFPLSRIGADTREHWEWPKVRLIGHVGRPAARVNLLDTIGRSYLNGTLFLNDPDVIFFRSENCSLSWNEKELIALVNFCLGSQLMVSDDPRRLTREDLDFTGRVLSLYERLTGYEYGVQALAREVYHIFSRCGTIQGLINLRRRPIRLSPGGKAGSTWKSAVIKTPTQLETALQKGEALVSHGKPYPDGSMLFEGPSISLYSAKTIQG